MNHHTGHRAASLVRCLMASGFDLWAIERDDLPLAVLMGFTGTVNAQFSERTDYNLHRLASELSKFSSSCVTLVSPELVTPDLVCTMLQNTTEVTPAMVPYLDTHAYCVSNMLDVDCLFRLCLYGTEELQSLSVSRPFAHFMDYALRRLSASSPLCDLSKIPYAVALCDTEEKTRDFFRQCTVPEARTALTCRELSHEVLLEVHNLHGIPPLNSGLRNVRNFRMLLDIIPSLMDETSVDFTQFLHHSMLKHRLVLETFLDELRPHVACRSLFRFLSAEFTPEYIVQRAGVIAYACFPEHASDLFEACNISVALPLANSELDIIFEYAEVYVDTLDMRAAMYNVLETLRITDPEAYARLWRVQTAGCVAVAMYANSINDILQQSMRLGLRVEATENLVELQSAFAETITAETLEMIVERDAVDMEWFSASTVDMVLPYLDRVLSVEDVLLPSSSDATESIFLREEVVTAYALKFRNHHMFFGAVVGSSMPVSLKLRIFARAMQGGPFPISMLESAIFSFAYSWSPRLLYNYQPTIHPEVERVEGVSLLDDNLIRLGNKTRVMVGPRARKCMFVMDMMRREGGMKSESSCDHKLVLVQCENTVVVGMRFEQRKMAFASLAHRIRCRSRDLLMLLQRGIVYRLVTWGSSADIDLPECGIVRALYSVQFNTLHWGNYCTLDDDMLHVGNCMARCNLPLVRARAVAHYLYTYVAYFILMWFYNYREERLEDILRVIDESIGAGLACRRYDPKVAAQQLGLVVTENALVSTRCHHRFTEADLFVDAVVTGALAKLCEDAQSAQN
ncbi:hypothetical protein BVTX09c1_029 [Bovine papular stomatitis virus]|uniref:Uncharacterized protein n=1 Tax=Bovine papular stomatitis virus TaxID=129727 RepID=A0A0E3T7P9_9POXV|nr:hypothetical protein BVTX09c1_029 [Bovine papular stomatitis virus]